MTHPSNILDTTSDCAIYAFLEQHALTVWERRLPAAIRDVLLSAPKKVALRTQTKCLVQLLLGEAVAYAIRPLGHGFSNHGIRGPGAFENASLYLPADPEARQASFDAIAEQFWSQGQRRELMFFDDEFYFATVPARDIQRRHYDVDQLRKTWARYRDLGFRRVAEVCIPEHTDEYASDLASAFGRTIVLPASIVSFITRADLEFITHVLKPELLMIRDLDTLDDLSDHNLTETLINDSLPVPYVIYATQKLVDEEMQGPDLRREKIHESHDIRFQWGPPRGCFGCLRREKIHESHYMVPPGDPDLPDSHWHFEEFLIECLNEFPVQIAPHHASFVHYIHDTDPPAAREYIRRGFVEGWDTPYSPTFASLDGAVRMRHQRDWKDEPRGVWSMDDVFDDIDLPFPYRVEQWTSPNYKAPDE